MTNRTSQAAAYDNAYNEGGEGYNPYRHTVPVADAPRARTADDIRRDLDACGMDPRHAADVAALRAELAALVAAEDAEFAAEWTPEVTADRRAGWNARVMAGEFGTRTIDYRAAAAAERAQGWTNADLRRAIALNSL
jgi:hypothetical protein